MWTYLGTLSRAHNLLEQRLEASIVETGLTASELLVMQVALEEREPTIAAILNATGLRPSTLSSLLTRLERRGYVRRTGGARDGRSRLVALTLPGDRAARIATSIQLELENAIAEPKRRMKDLAVLDAVGREISLLPPPPIDPADGLPIATA